MTTTTDPGDILTINDAEGDDLAIMEQGCHYNYKRQTWVDGCDHAHFFSDDGPLFPCGADLESCQG